MEVKFFADSMLGKLARWLRLMGFDTRYNCSISDEELIKIAKKENRIILTKDREMVNKNKKYRGNNFIFISDSDTDQQIKTVIKSLNLNPWKGLFSRCVYCNHLVEKIEDVTKFKDKIPPYALVTSPSFYYCPVCNRVYWEGSHHKKIKEKIKNLMKEG